MSDKLVPANVALAAKRGFIRTTAQAYAATIPTGGVSVGAIITLVEDPNPVLFWATAISAVVTPVLAGLASFLSIVAAGIPQAYMPEIPPKDAETGDVEPEILAEAKEDEVFKAHPVAAPVEDPGPWPHP